MNTRLLQDHEIENYGSPKGFNELLDEVKNVVDKYLSGTPLGHGHGQGNGISPTNPHRSINLNINDIGNGNTPHSYLAQQLRTSTSLPAGRFQLNPSAHPSPQSQSPGSAQRTPSTSATDTISKAGLRELSNMLNRQREGEINIRAIRQIAALYRQARQAEAQRTKFVEEIVKGSCLRSLLSFLTLREPSSNSSFEYIAQLESLELLALLTESDAIKSYIRHTGDLPIIVNVLGWAHRSQRSLELNFSLIDLICNLATQESCASILKKSGAIPPIFNMATNQYMNGELRILSINTLIIFTSYSDPKISEAIIDSASSLRMIIQQIHENSILASNEDMLDSIAIKMLDLLYRVSDCAKTRAIAYECGIERLVELLKVNEIYPKYLNQGNYFVVSNTSVSPANDPTAAQAKVQGKVLQCLEKLAQHENNRVKIGMAGLFNCMSYLKPMYLIPSDIFRWNINILEKVLKFLIQLLNNDNIKQVFVEKDGCNIIVSMVSSDFLPTNIRLSCAQVLGQFVSPKKTESSRIYYSVDKVMSNEIVPSLMKLFKSYPDETSLQLLVCKVFTNLGEQDELRQTIFSEGGIQLLHHLLTNPDIEVVTAACESLAVLSNNKFIRKVLRLLDSVGVIVRHLNGGVQQLKRGAIQTLYNVSRDDEGLLMLLDNHTGVSPLTIYNLLFSNDTITQTYAIKLLVNLSLDDQYVNCFVTRGGLNSLINALYSNNEALQHSVLDIMNVLLQSNKLVQESIFGEGIIEKLKKLTAHENLANPSSILLQPLRTLFITIKQLQPPESPPYHQQHVSNKSPHTPISSTTYVSPPSGPSPPHNTITSVSAPDFKRIENVLGKLDPDQLIQVIMEMVKHDASLADLVPVAIKSVLTGNRLPTPVYSTPPPSTSPSPPPAPRHVAPQKTPAAATSTTAPGNKRGGNKPPPPEKKKMGFSCLMEEIMMKVPTGKLNLRHVDMEKEAERRQKSMVMQNQSNILKDIVNIAQRRKTEQTANKRVLVDTSIVNGMRIWKKDFELWKQELQGMFRRDVNLTVLIYRIMDSVDKEFPFDEAMDIAKVESPESLAQSLCRVGFNVKQSRYTSSTSSTSSRSSSSSSNNNNDVEVVESIEYISISKPTGMPYKLLLSTILEYMQ
ncbi:hypothetical protein SAMD00019534_030600 [Acytostelium subglobosum LB1]|uniref:hypothetical protein n=1 Tax=Acytostelium subglobosum LB1 TaxID=1410327 RepID=UPI000644DBA4|nr:hypothetical protein SAMD00019534_030600 [Acytostelium subglobosum LB1]GAM19885.1 hypothetical protein SAMD00019534_030600 [Acytostelium subglobosum LB1]|eukprot:XP_012756647.1 hypothetical protein SAMD00019534_030600 [Acytostelium subglobosum LB1]